MAFDRKLVKHIDWGIVLSVSAILGISLAVLWSASRGMVPGDPFYYVKRQATWMLLGGAGLIVLLFIDYGLLAHASRYLYMLNVAILILVLLVGTKAHGTKGWINMGPFLFQPSEFSKVLTVLTFSSFLSSREGHIHTWKDLLTCFAYVAPPVLLVLLQPDMGTALVFGAIVVGMLFIAGANPAMLCTIAGGAIGCLVLALVAHFRWGLPLPLEDYQIMRLVVFIDPYADGQGGQGAGYNIIQSLVAIGSGAFWGRGLGQGTQAHLNFLPEHHTDFIFSVVGEELGFVGAAGILALYFYFLYRSLRIAYEAKDNYGTLVACGIVSMIAFHLLVNVGMTIGIMPITGIPLPLFSYGGSAMISNLMAVGLIINIGMRRHKILF